MEDRLGHFPVDAKGSKEAIVKLTLQFLTLYFCEICDGQGVGHFGPPDVLVGNAGFESCEPHFF